MDTATRTKLGRDAEFVPRALISQAVYDVLSDPDFGLELSVKAKKRLLAARRYSGPLIPLAEVRRKYL